MSDTKYNGWANYITWSVHLYLLNDQEHDTEARSIVADAQSDLRAEEALQDYVRDTWVDRPGGSDCNVMRDFATWALGQVDWAEIRKAFEGV